jgi:hypothetical protein
MHRMGLKFSAGHSKVLVGEMKKLGYFIPHNFWALHTM